MRRLLLLSSLLLLLSLIPYGHAAYAQGGEDGYVDVGLSVIPVLTRSSTTRTVNVVVYNQGSSAAFDVEVVVDIVYPRDTSFFEQRGEIPIGTVSLENGRTTFRWSITELEPLQRVDTNTADDYLQIVTRVSAGDAAFDNATDPHEFFGEVTTSSYESDVHKGNNTTRRWSAGYQSGTVVESEHAEGDYSIGGVSVDERSPSPGDIVNFTIAASYGGDNVDSKITIELTGGLAVDEDPDATPPRAISYVIVPSGVSAPIYSDGVFTIGSRNDNDDIGQLQATVPVRVASDAVVNEQCLTATITGNPPPGLSLTHDHIVYDDIRDNAATVCLGLAPDEKVVFSDGTADLWALYPCVAATSFPCDDTDSVILAVNGLSAAANAGAPYTVFEPEGLVVHIQDRVGRTASGGSISWNNGHDVDSSAWGAGITPGLVAKFNRSVTGTVSYSQFRASVEVDAPGEGVDEGDMNVVYASNFGFGFFDTAASPPVLSFGPYDWDEASPLFFRFNRLGTYTMDLTMGALYDANPTDSTLPSDPEDLYSDTATYTFHVGPMADLKVRDGGPSPHAALDQHALTVVAASNGPDRAPAARVTGLPTGAEVIHVSQGSYDGASGVWDVGEMRRSLYYRSTGRTEPTLVLGAAAGDTATVSIENTVDYTVCIDSSSNDVDATTENLCTPSATSTNAWYTTPVYDYDAGNSTARIRARAGVEGLGAPSGQGTEDSGPAITVRWRGVASVNGVPVSHYELQRQTNPWQTIARNLVGTEYVDTNNVEPGQTYQYRVRAFNEVGVAGSWSRPMEGALAAPAPSRDDDDDDDDDDYAFFATQVTTRSVAENSPAGSPVGNPVVADASRGNRVTYSLEGDDAEHFDIEADSGQILVGSGLVLDHEAGPATYTVVVVADPRRGQGDRVTVTINVVDVPEPGRLTLSPAGAPAVAEELTAAVAHPDSPDGDLTVVSWQWQRSPDGMTWTVVEGADGAAYSPTEADAGHRLRVIVLYRPSGDDPPLVLTGLVTAPLAGTADADDAAPTTVEEGTETSPAAEERAVLYLLPLEGAAVGEMLVAALTHPGGQPRVISWQWQRSVEGVHWQVIEGADQGSYVPTTADAGHLLRVIVSYHAPGGGLELAGAATARLPGTPAAAPATDPTPEPASAAQPQPQPTPLPVAAASPSPTATPMPVPALASAAASPPAASATPVPRLITSSSLAGRGVGAGVIAGDSRPADGSAAAGQAPEAAGQPLGATPLLEQDAADPGTPETGGPAAAQDGGRGILVWVVLALFAALVLGGGLGYYQLRMRRR